jgi:predicted nuclease of predicted toxin-antitoxin system
LKLLLDENLSSAHARRLRHAGHDAVAVVDVGLGGADDAAVRQFALEHGRVLVTLDSDFSHAQRSPLEGTQGVIWLRPWPPTESAIEVLMDGTIRQLEGVEIVGKLVVSGPGRIRIR